MPIYIKQVTYEERAVHGVCPVCGAEQGEPCDMTQGITLRKIDEFSEVGVHLARLFNAPEKSAVMTQEVDDGTTSS